MNKETIEYNILNSITFTQFNKYTMWTFIPLYLLLTIFAGTAMRMDFDAKNIKLLLLIIFVYNLVISLLYFRFYIGYYKKIKSIKKQLDTANNFICNNIYKNRYVLNKLINPQEYSDLRDKVVKGILNDIPVDIKPEELAKIYYTLHLYEHLHKLGNKDANINDALNSFSPFKIIASCDFIQYFNRYGSYIETINTKLSMYTPNNIPNKTVTKAFNICDENITDTNNLANSINLDNSIPPFITLFSINFILQILPYITPLIIDKMAKNVSQQIVMKAKIIQQKKQPHQ